MVCPNALEAVSSCIGSACTVMASWKEPTCSCTFRVAVSVMLIFTCLITAGVKSFFAASTLYTSGGSKPTRYVPLSCVIALRVCPELMLVTVMVAPGITLPLGSVTVPFSAPVCAVCAKLGAPEKQSNRKIAANAVLVVENVLPSARALDERNTEIEITLRVFFAGVFMTVLLEPAARLGGI